MPSPVHAIASQSSVSGLQVCPSAQPVVEQPGAHSRAGEQAHDSGRQACPVPTGSHSAESSHGFCASRQVPHALASPGAKQVGALAAQSRSPRQAPSGKGTSLGALGLLHAAAHARNSALILVPCARWSI